MGCSAISAGRILLNDDPIKLADERKQEDLQLWKLWKDGGKKPDDLRPLLNNFRGMIHKESNRFAGNVELPPAAIHAEFTRQAVHAFDTYTPTKGAALGSWVGTNLQKGRRFVATYQNTARIGEHRHYKVGQFQNAQAMLNDQLGREPTNQELSEQLQWSPVETTRMGAEIRKGNIASAFDGDPTIIRPSNEMERLRLVKYDLTPEERLIYEYTLGEGGKPQLRPGQIAEKLKISPSKVTRVRDSIYRKATVGM